MTGGSGPQWLSISVTFPAGRYHGEEWPPSPARLFQALLAGLMTGGYRALWPVAAPLLHWLEAKEPPLIISAAAERSAHYSLAVPNNDLDKAGEAWRRGADYNVAKLRTMKTVKLREMPCQTAPHLHYLWKLDEEGFAAAASLPALTDCLHTLGWGIDMAYARSAVMTDSEVSHLDGERWIPATGARDRLRVPVTGYLADCLSAYDRFKARITPRGIHSDTRAAGYGEQPYRRGCDLGLHYAAFALERDGRTFSRDWDGAMVVAGWLRHAAAEAMREERRTDAWVNEYVLGHSGNAPAERHLSFVPLPTVGMDYNDGRIRRVMLVEPADMDGSVSTLLQTKLPGRMLMDRDKRPVCRLAEQDKGCVWELYLGKSKVWRSVTPMVLHGHNSVRGRISVVKTERLIVQAFVESGYPADLLDGLAFQTAPMWAGAGAATQMMLPTHLRGWPRYHVELRMCEAVAGPLLIGIGRHYGLGVFAAAK